MVAFYPADAARTRATARTSMRHEHDNKQTQHQQQQHVSAEAVGACKRGKWCIMRHPVTGRKRQRSVACRRRLRRDEHGVEKKGVDWWVQGVRRMRTAREITVVEIVT